MRTQAKKQLREMDSSAAILFMKQALLGLSAPSVGYS